MTFSVTPSLLTRFGGEGAAAPQAWRERGALCPSPGVEVASAARLYRAA